MAPSVPLGFRCLALLGTAIARLTPILLTQTTIVASSRGATWTLVALMGLHLQCSQTLMWRPAATCQTGTKQIAIRILLGMPAMCGGVGDPMIPTETLHIRPTRPAIARAPFRD